MHHQPLLYGVDQTNLGSPESCLGKQPLPLMEVFSPYGFNNRGILLIWISISQKQSDSDIFRVKYRLMTGFSSIFVSLGPSG